MKPLHHLTSEERDKITVLQGEGLSIRKIAKELGRSPSTISRELNRPEALFFRGKYIGSQTHKKVKSNWKQAHKRENVYLKDKSVKRFIESSLKYGYSPAIISSMLRQRFNIKLSHESIYIYIYAPKRNLTQFLLRRKIGRKHRQMRLIKQGTGKNIPNRVDIDLRSKLANLRIETGHFECDSVESGRQRGQKRNSCLTVMVDRASRKTIIKKTASKTSVETTKSILKAMKPYQNTIKSITYDNGCEFSKHEKINKELNIKSYFCKPYHSWEKGTVENINGLIRRFFPKGTNFDTITEESISYVEDWINNRPMKILNYMTPNQKFQLLGVAIAS
jgi:transposase, IS30 family